MRSGAGASQGGRTSRAGGSRGRANGWWRASAAPCVCPSLGDLFRTAGPGGAPCSWCSDALAALLVTHLQDARPPSPRTGLAEHGGSPPAGTLQRQVPARRPGRPCSLRPPWGCFVPTGRVCVCCRPPPASPCKPVSPLGCSGLPQAVTVAHPCVPWWTAGRVTAACHPSAPLPACRPATHVGSSGGWLPVLARSGHGAREGGGPVTTVRRGEPGPVRRGQRSAAPC